ncbi:MAG: AAA family ATPase [Phycisphaeraceae bacterium]|nr:AAA family ATPase [Phycisphaeraceae bacterium]
MSVDSHNPAEISKRVEQVMRFLAEVSRRRNPVVRRWTGYDWTLDLTALPRHSAVRVGAENDDSSVLLWVKRPKETPCDPPPTSITDWVLPGWSSPDGDAQVLASRNFMQGEETITVAFAQDPGRAAAFEHWKQSREKWVAAELPVRRVAALFQRLFELRGRLERESERLVLCVGDGMLRWVEERGPVEHPLLLHRLELRFEPKVPSFELRYTNDAHELNSPLLRELGVDGKALAQLRETLLASEFGLLDPKATGYLTELVHRLFKRGEVLAAKNDAMTDHAVVHRQGVVMLMPRSGGIINAIDAFVERLNENGEVPEPLRSVVMGDAGDDDEDTGGGETSEDREADLSVPPRGHRRAPVDLLLTKPANPEQQTVVQALARRGKVVVQGPPGTGKTHTIANLIGHLLAEGKSVLVTSHSTKALKVLRDKVAEDLRPLCVAVLDRDSEGQHLLESSVKGIISGLQRPKSERAAEADRSSKARTKLLATLKSQEQGLSQAIKDEYDDIVIGGRGIAPSKAARMVKDQRSLHEWLPGPLERGVLCPLSDEEVRDVYRLGTIITLEDDAEINVGLPPMSDVIKPAEFEKALGMIANAKSKAADPRPDLWADGSNQSLDDLRAVHALAGKMVRAIKGAHPLAMECMDCGRLGGARREPWDDLVKTVERLAAEIDQHSAAVVKHSPTLHEKWPRAMAAVVIEQVVVHVQSRGSLSIWRGLCRPPWLLLQATSKVRGAAPKSHEDFTALRSLLARDQLRRDLERRWASQVGALAQATHGNLGPRPEDIAREHLSTINGSVNWHESVWTEFQRKLEALGFNWAAARELVAPRSEAGGELRRWAEVIEKFVIPAVEARAYRREIENIQSRIDAVRAKLAAAREGRIARALARALASKSAPEYTGVYKRYLELLEKQEASERRTALLARLAPLAPKWADAITRREEPHHAATVPSNPSEAWLWRQWEQELARRAATDINDLQRACTETKNRLQEETARYVSARVWECQRQKCAGEARSALMGLLETWATPGFKSGVRSETLQREARQLMKKATPAVPVWIMPLAKVVESYDFRVAQFDVVIIDEASQCDMTGLVALGIAKSAIVVGDDKQVSPLAVGQALLPLDALISEYLQGVPNHHLYTGRRSLYNFATTGFGDAVRLVEHFRCVNEIIQFSNHLSYDGEIKPLRESSTILTRPFVVSHRVAGASRQGHVNEAEALEAVSLIVAICEQPEYIGKTIGVISMLGEEQALLIDRLLRARITETAYAERDILCGTPPQFQGDERDVILLSLVDHAPDGPLRMRADDDLKKRYNVAASRAKDQLWVVHSLNAETDLKEGDLRSRLIKHAIDPQATQRQLQEQGQRVESEFERLVLKSLTESGYRVQTQWKVGAFRIDMVVIGGDGHSVALECDGDRFHPPEEIGRDLDRQRILERLGWRFVRLRGSEYFRDPIQTMTRVRTRLKEFGVEAIGAEASRDSESGDDTVREHVIRRAEELRRTWAEEDAPESEQEESPAEAQQAVTVPVVSQMSGTASDLDGDGEVHAVYAAIREARVPIGRAEIIDRSGIDPASWLSAIRTLVRDGVVVMQGSKRGARYALPAAAASDSDLFADAQA